LGKIHLERSAFGNARDLLQRALDRELELSPADAPQAVGIALDLARAEASLGENAAAEARLRARLQRLDSAAFPAPSPALLAPRPPARRMCPAAGQANRALALRRNRPAQPPTACTPCSAAPQAAIAGEITPSFWSEQQRSDRRSRDSSVS
jgi:hypothetical protein